MFCQHCGSEIPDGSKFCTYCGGRFDAVPAAPQPPQQQQYQQQYQQPQYQQQQQQQYRPPQYQQAQYQQNQPYAQYQQQPQGGVSFIEAIKRFFVNYVNFTGRATRSEFWWVVLFSAIVDIVLMLIARDAAWLYYIVSLALFLPSLSISIRRLHDIGKPWPWFLMGLIPIAGIIILIVYFVRPSDGDNRWGPGPRA